MNLAATIEMNFGGPGSGCKGDNCGRKPTGRDGKEEQELLDFHNKIVGNPARLNQPFERFSKQQQFQLESLLGLVSAYRGRGLGDRKQSKQIADEIKTIKKLLNAANVEPFVGQKQRLQEAALMKLHSVIRRLYITATPKRAFGLE